MVSYSLPRLFLLRVATLVRIRLLGVLQGMLAARMPAIKDGADLPNGTLGLALLGMPLGSLAAIQVTGRLIARWGSSPVTFAGLLVLCVATAGPSFATGFATLLPALILFGIGLGLTDTAMNAQAVTVERGYGRPIMSSFHGYASLVALAGAPRACCRRPSRRQHPGVLSGRRRRCRCRGVHRPPLVAAAGGRRASRGRPLRRVAPHAVDADPGPAGHDRVLGHARRTGCRGLERGLISATASVPPPASPPSDTRASP